MPPMACLLQTTSIERILYSVDYPYSDTTQGHEFLRKLRESGLVSDDQYEMITFKNAQQLLRIAPKGNNSAGAD